MAKSPKNPPRDPAKHSKKDPAKPTRAKASRPDSSPMEPSLADLLNPAIGKGTAGVGAQTGLEPKPEHERAASRRRTIRSTAARIFPPRTGRANRPRASTRRRSRTMSAKRRTSRSRSTPSSPRRSATACRATRTSTRTPRRRASPPPRRRWTSCCARAARNSTTRRGRDLDAAPPAAAGEIRRRPAARHQVRLRAEGRPAAGDQGTGRGREAPRPQPGAARRHRLGQDLHHGEGDRGDAAPGADPRAQQDAGGAALRRVQELLSRQRGRVFRLRITTTTSRKPTSRAPTPISRRNPRSTSRSTACATRRRARCSNATTWSSSPRCRASTVSARSRPIRR